MNANGSVIPGSRAAAIAIGARRYFNGEPCPRGHLAARLTSNSTCVVCTKAAVRKWMDANRERVRTKARKWARAAYPRRKEVLRQRRKARRLLARDSERRRAGLPAPTRPCPATCEICGRAPREQSILHLDHDHGSGEFRGWLCARCNLALGKLGDSLESVNQWTARALAYLSAPRVGG